MQTIRAMPILQVRDVAASVAFWERLGFQGHGIWEGPPDFGIVQRGNVSLGLSGTGAGTPGPEMWACYLYVTDIDALHAEFAGLELEHLTEPRDQPYGCRDFELADPDGHRVAFGQDLSANPHGPGLGPEAGRG